ncbi:hypothetical protein DFH94DRAFT_728905 [Russula ochroleuca]|uniref:Uncharacterized protein n=1 Tax=Russula ochroleuca TaxID=152965 RepID=A0A9P5TB25_9AGAM|nr:hypothetical protein DFH94DRAFT_728905 [Russula ochroleuca]
MADSFSLLINDSSPILTYFPFADTLSIPNFFEGWNPCFSTACPTFPGQQVNGSSFHVTSMDGAAFSIQWWGNGIQLSGIATGPVTYDLQLDDHRNSSISPSTSGSILLAEYDDLQPGNHTLSLIVHNPTNSTSALIAIDNALITVNSTSPNTAFSNTVIDDTSLPFTGQWSFLNGSSLSALDDTYHTTTNAGDFLNFNFSGTAVTVFGFRDKTSRRFSVKLDNASVILNGASSVDVATTLFFRTGLNNSLHTLTITNEDNSLLAVGSINVTTASTHLLIPSSGLSSRLSRGTIAAIVVASALGALVFLITAFFLWRRRRQFGRILHRRRLFVAPNGNDHSKVLDIVRGPEEVDDLEDMYEDKPPGNKSRQPTSNGSGSLSFTLDLPIQSRPSLPPSQRDYSGNSAQELPRSPTVSLGRPGTHHRGSSHGVPLHEISAGDGVDNDETRRPPSSIALGQATNEGIFTSGLPRDQEMVEHTEGRTFRLTPVASVSPLPRPGVASSAPAQGGSDQSQPSFSFLDISASSQASSASVRHPAVAASPSSSSFGSTRQRSTEPLVPTQRISLPFAMGFHRDPPESARPPSMGIEFPRFSLNIRPLPQIPRSAAEPGIQSSVPTPPRRATRSHAESIPSLRLRTEFDHPPNIPRSVSTTTAPPISAVSGGNRAPHIVVHPSSFLRAHPRTSSVISPTESVPVTVSDIHFRHSSDDERGEPESRRTSAGVSEHPPPHPPLPQRSYTSPFIMHKLFGTPAVPPTAPIGGQFSLQSPGAGPSTLRDPDVLSGSPPVTRQRKRTS